jgi:hypothetical protein
VSKSVDGFFREFGTMESGVITGSWEHQVIYDYLYPNLPVKLQDWVSEKVADGMLLERAKNSRD